MSAEPLVDGHGRLISDLRVSVTDRCNFRCQYCMPAEGLAWLGRSEVLSFEEIERLVRLFAGLGVTDVRLTGGSRSSAGTSPPSWACWPGSRASKTSP
jgi:cyclic pyranopterin phosphate synthase